VEIGGSLESLFHNRLTLTTADEEPNPSKSPTKAAGLRPAAIICSLSALTRIQGQPSGHRLPRMIASTLSSLSFSPASTRWIILARATAGVAGQESSKIALAGKFKMACA
jgi:hypothetical protein